MNEHKRILLVDDDSSVLLVMRATLENLEKDTELVTAGSGKEALMKFKQEAFDLVISDVKMPGIDGIELVEAIRRLDTNAAVIWITAYGCRKLEENMQRLDVYRCLEKPLRIQEIRLAAREAMVASDNGQAS
ncbi:MAG: response regulator [Anaerolineales bacterium]|jgi:DNA-binding NtrC family response regulator